MKTTVDIPEKELKDAILFAKAKTKREAIVIALTDFNRRQRVKRLLKRFGKMDGIMTQEELRKMREAP